MTVVVLPAGEVRTIRPSFDLVDRLLPLVSAAVEGDRVLLPGGCRLRYADLAGQLLMASITDAVGIEVSALIVAAVRPAADQAWRRLRAGRLDLPLYLPAPWCAVMPAGDLPLAAGIARCWDVPMN